MRVLSPARKAIRAAATTLKVTEYVDYKDYLGAIYQNVKDALGSYSYLKFAGDLGFGHINMMRLIIIGQRPLTSKTAQKIARGLDLHGDERRYFTTMVEYSHKRDGAERDKLFRWMMEYKSRAVPDALDDKQVRYFSEWYNPVIRELTALSAFQPDPEWIRNKLNFPLHMSEIKKALDVLVDLGFVKLDERTGKYRRTKARIHTPFEVDSLAIVRFHQKMIEIARESITRVREDEREVTALTATISPKAIPEIKRRIQQLFDEVEAMEDSGEDAQVFQLNVQLFPFSKR